MEATLMAQQTPSQREQVRGLQPQAVASWWAVGHPGWAIHPLDSEQFLATGVAEPMAAPAPAAMHGTPPPQQQQPMGLPAELLAGSMFGGIMGQQQQQMPAWATNQQLLQQLAAAGAAAPHHQQHSPRPPPVPAGAANGGFDFSAGNLSVFQQLLPSAAHMASFPATMPSAELEGMLTPGASILGLGYNPRLPSLGKLESVDLHQDGVDAVAMLHDLTARGLQTPRMSALESMQSIEQSLDGH